MDKPKVYSNAEVFLSCVAEKYYSNEVIIKKNSLIRMISGEMKIVQADKSYLLRAGDTILFPRNGLAMITKYPVDGQPYKSVCVYITQDLLQKYYAVNHPIHIPDGMPAVTLFDKHPLLESLFDSILPYFNLADALPASIAAVKVEEAISILRSIDKNIDNTLAHFDEPGKIALEDFMEKNFMFNMPMEKFGYLTGRSLTTFKRDFKKAFSITPQRWLTKKRLELAHYQILEKKRKPADVYAEVGFENLSHFSFAFKKRYGLSPNQLKIRV